MIFWLSDIGAWACLAEYRIADNLIHPIPLYGLGSLDKSMLVDENTANMQIEKGLYFRILEKKKKLDSLRPFQKDALEKLREFLLVELTYNTNAIEGNTLSRQETRLVLEEGLTIGGKTLREHLEAVNHPAALNAVEKEVKEKKVTEAFVLYLHSLVLKGITDKYAGGYRDQNVRISGSKYTPPQHYEVGALMKNFVHEINESKLPPIQLAALAHFRTVDIHPFIDGNGRVARLLMNLVLLKHGFPMTIIQKAERKKYYDTLEKAHFGNLEPFVNFVARAVERSLDIYLDALERNRKPEEKFISLAEAAKHCAYSQEYLSLLARKGKLDATKFGRNWVTTKKAIETYSSKTGRKQAG